MTALLCCEFFLPKLTASVDAAADDGVLLIRAADGEIEPLAVVEPVGIVISAHLLAGLEEPAALLDGSCDLAARVAVVAASDATILTFFMDQCSWSSESASERDRERKNRLGEVSLELAAS